MEIWPQATVQQCVVHLVRSSLQYASKAHWSRLTKDLRQIYTAPTPDAAQQRFAEFEAEWGERYPAIIRLWQDAWPTFTPFLAFPAEIPPVTLVQDLRAGRAGLDRRDGGERGYRRSSRDQSAGLRHPAHTSGRWSGPDPLADARSAQQVPSLVARARGGR